MAFTKTGAPESSVRVAEEDVPLTEVDEPSEEIDEEEGEDGLNASGEEQ